jgi:hypothetical protein
MNFDLGHEVCTEEDRQIKENNPSRVLVSLDRIGRK